MRRRILHPALRILPENLARNAFSLLGPAGKVWAAAIRMLTGMGPSLIRRIFLCSFSLCAGSTSLHGQSVPNACQACTIPDRASQEIRNRGSKPWLASMGLICRARRPGTSKSTYDHFDSDGDNDSSGSYEEWFASPSKYKRIYSSENSTQTEVATRAGLFLSGSQKWPGAGRDRRSADDHRAISIAPPWRSAATRRTTEANGIPVMRLFPCIALRKTDLTVTMNFEIGFPKFCFGPDLPIVRYSSGLGWKPSTRASATHEGRYVAKAAKVIRGGRSYLDIQVEELETITEIKAADFAAPADAVRVGDTSKYRAPSCRTTL